MLKKKRSSLRFTAIGLPCLAAILYCATAFSVESISNDENSELTPEASHSGPATRKLNLLQMGRPTGYQLTGIATTGTLNAGIRLDEIIESATLNLKMIYPPGLSFEESFIRISVNNQLAAVHQLDPSKAGVSHEVALPLDASLFTDFAPIQIEFLGSPASIGRANCLSPTHPALRLDISPESFLELKASPLAVINDLGILPAPFFDPRDQRPLNLPFVLPEKTNLQLLRASGLLASWFGAQASYRQAQFTAMNTLPEDQHAIILSKGDRLPPSMQLKDLAGPTIVLDSDPNQPHLKRLYLIGRTDQELIDAVLGLVLEGQVLSGNQATIKRVEPGPPRKPYDSPRYVPTDRPVRLSELLDFPTQLEVSSQSPEARLNLKLPPDLFSWAGKNVDFDLQYRYTAPSNWNDSLLTIEINNNLLQSIRLPPRSEQNENRLNLSLLGQDTAGNNENLKIPAFRVGGNNQISFRFLFAEEGQRSCNGQPLQARGSIDPSSTLDFSELPHYIRMPDLAAFANAGYPFSIHADLAETAVVIPTDPRKNEIGQFLNLMGLFGQWNGIPAFRVTLTYSNDLQPLENKNWIAFGPLDELTWLEPFELDMPMQLKATSRSLSQSLALRTLDGLWNNSTENLTSPEQGRAFIRTSGPLGAIMSFESPFSPKKAGVVVTGTDSESFSRAMGALADYGDIAQIRGSVALVRGDKIESFRVGETYIAGSLPWYLQMRIAFTKHPLLISLVGIFAGLFIAMGLFSWLSARARAKIRIG